MIELLRIENLALVESVELEFGPGLNVLTGETGAGKSIVLGALALLSGGRAAGDALRSGSEQGAVEAKRRLVVIYTENRSQEGAPEGGQAAARADVAHDARTDWIRPPSGVALGRANRGSA